MANVYTMIIESVEYLHILQHHKTVTANARMLHEYDMICMLSCVSASVFPKIWRRLLSFFLEKENTKIQGAPQRGSFGENLLTNARGTGLHLTCAPSDLTRTGFRNLYLYLGT